MGFAWDLVGGIPTPLKNMSSSMGRMTSHILWKIKNVPNHQPGMFDFVFGDRNGNGIRMGVFYAIFWDFMGLFDEV